MVNLSTRLVRPCYLIGVAFRLSIMQMFKSGVASYRSQLLRVSKTGFEEPGSRRLIAILLNEMFWKLIRRLQLADKSKSNRRSCELTGFTSLSRLDTYCFLERFSITVYLSSV